jgi:DNA-directed RNA polymerase subunit RPC12/RpoP
MSEYEGGTYRCAICAKEFLLKDEADRHFSEVHSEERTYVME